MAILPVVILMMDKLVLMEQSQEMIRPMGTYPTIQKEIEEMMSRLFAWG